MTNYCLITTWRTKIRIWRTLLHHRNHDHGTQTNKIKRARKRNKATMFRKRDLKRKFTDQKTVEAKIARTELSIEKLEKHISCGTCPKSLQYPAKPNVAADILFEKELRDIKLKAEQSLISALTRFHKRKRQIQEKKLKANVAFAARKQKPVTRNPLKETHSAHNIVHNDVNIADLQKQISDLKEIVCTHILKNKKEECYNSLFSDYTNNSPNNTNLHLSKNKRRKNGETPCKIGAKQRKGRQMKNSFTTYQAINLLTAKSAYYQGVSNSFQRLRQTKQELSNNCCEILNNLQGG